MSNLNFTQTKIENTGSKIFPLTTREQEIQNLLTTGMTNKMIANKLGICEGTVKIHIKNLMRKLNACSRLEVAMLALGLSMKTQIN
jgi:two-component system nitrate/nitrite response regulator NarL